MLIPGTFSPVVIPDKNRLVILVLERVETPATFKSTKVFGAFETADSIAAVVVASREEIFFNCPPELTIYVNPSLYEVALKSPNT